MLRMSSDEIGLRLRSVRGNLSQREFGDRLATSSGRVSEIEKGKTVPGGDFLLRLNQEFGTDITWLLTGQHAATHGSPELAQEIQELVDQFALLPEQDQAVVRRTIDALVLAAFKQGVGRIRRKYPPAQGDASTSVHQLTPEFGNPTQAEPSGAK